ncbi:MAG: DUF2244 domain-containing protein [Alphaproteobacteria bacterium]|jgi:uncharacterized membrane protein|nr:DUF2244 domain-containing protein [Alphaproteobacteria bacterium]
MSAIDAHPPPDPAFRFDAFLHPHRSLSIAGFRLLMAVLIVISLIIGGVFLAAGAWPIFGFYGLDILIIYLALRKNYKNALIYEKVRLNDDILLVEKGDRHGVTESWTFQPYWLRVHVDDPDKHHARVRLTSHGTSVIVGAFLSPEERLEFAAALRRALSEVRGPQPQEAGGL